MNRSDLPANYEAWLALSDEQRDALMMGWNAYEREGIGFAYTAAGRLAIASATPVLDIRIGTYHGGEYLLHPYVDDAALPNLPKPLEQTFEGFRVWWFPQSQLTR